MDLSQMGFSPQKLEKLNRIVTLGKQLGDDPQIGKVLMNQFFTTIFEEERNEKEDYLNDLASAYSLTEDPGLKEDFVKEFYKSKGIDPAQKVSSEALQSNLLERFREEFPTDVRNPSENVKLQQLAVSNPSFLEQYYGNLPEDNTNWLGNIGGGIAGGAATGAIGGSIIPGLGTGMGAIGGGIAGGIGGLIGSIMSSNRSEQEKRKYLKDLVSQYNL